MCWRERVVNKLDGFWILVTGKFNQLFHILGLGLCVLLFSDTAAQSSNTPFLERSITIALNDERMDVALKKISEQAGFTFSYSPSILQGDRTVTYSFVNKTVREILDQLFSGTVQYKARGKYVILTKAMIGSAPKEPQVYSGYVVDEATGERLKNVSIYDPVTLSSTVTDSYGYFEIEIPKPSSDLRLAINKQNYTDTLVVIPDSKGRLLNIPISGEKIGTLADSVGKKIKRFWLNTKRFTKQQINIANIKDSIHRRTQLSIVPFIGTNHALSGNVINDYSFNMIGGYSLGVNKFEIGGAFNIVRGNVNGLQLAGTFNAVGGNVKGAQFAGVFNANYGTVEGAQFAGVFNVSWNERRYFAAAGVFNFSRRNSRAVQLAGVGNITIGDQGSPHMAGLFNFSSGKARSQIAGSYNIAGSDLTGWQMGGVFNIAGGDVHGAQTAGVFNVAGGEVRGAQIAGVMNIAGKGVRGAQVGAVLNYASKVHGVQVGLINIADSVGGVPIGLLSVVLKGYHKIELSADEIFYTNVAFRTGVRQFYNILTAGVKPSTFKDPETMWTFGYGLGTAPKLSRKLFLNFDITSNQIVQGNSFEGVNVLNKAYIGVDFQMLKKMSVTVGATLNAYITETTYDGYLPIFTDYQPNVFYNRDYGSDMNMKMWLGGKIGIRFL